MKEHILQPQISVKIGLLTKFVFNSVSEDGRVKCGVPDKMIYNQHIWSSISGTKPLQESAFLLPVYF
jgi:hypothetical protein